MKTIINFFKIKSKFKNKKKGFSFMDKIEQIVYNVTIFFT